MDDPPGEPSSAPTGRGKRRVRVPSNVDFFDLGEDDFESKSDPEDSEYSSKQKQPIWNGIRKKKPKKLKKPKIEDRNTKKQNIKAHPLPLSQASTSKAHLNQPTSGKVCKMQKNMGKEVEDHQLFSPSRASTSQVQLNQPPPGRVSEMQKNMENKVENSILNKSTRDSLPNGDDRMQHDVDSLDSTHNQAHALAPNIEDTAWPELFGKHGSRMEIIGFRRERFNLAPIKKFSAQEVKPFNHISRQMKKYGFRRDPMQAKRNDLESDCEEDFSSKKNHIISSSSLHRTTSSFSVFLESEYVDASIEKMSWMYRQPFPTSRKTFREKRNSKLNIYCDKHRIRFAILQADMNVKAAKTEDERKAADAKKRDADFEERKRMQRKRHREYLLYLSVCEPLPPPKPAYWVVESLTLRRMKDEEQFNAEKIELLKQLQDKMNTALARWEQLENDAQLHLHQRMEDVDFGQDSVVRVDHDYLQNNEVNMEGQGTSTEHPVEKIGVSPVPAQYENSSRGMDQVLNPSDSELLIPDRGGISNVKRMMRDPTVGINKVINWLENTTMSGEAEERRLALPEEPVRPEIVEDHVKAAENVRTNNFFPNWNSGCLVPAQRLFENSAPRAAKRPRTMEPMEDCI